jgi:hypothetical protein
MDPHRVEWQGWSEGRRSIGGCVEAGLAQPDQLRHVGGEMRGGEVDDAALGEDAGTNGSMG